MPSYLELKYYPSGSENELVEPIIPLEGHTLGRQFNFSGPCDTCRKPLHGRVSIEIQSDGTFTVEITSFLYHIDEQDEKNCHDPEITITQ